MRIEISSSGSGGAAVSEFQSNLVKYIGDVEGVISSFKTIKESTFGLNGGVGNLQGAFENVDARVRTEEEKLQSAKTVQNSANEFVKLALRVDECVSEKIICNKEELYRVNAWLRPTTSVEQEVIWYKQAWNWLCCAGEAITDEAKTVWNWVSDTAVKAWNGLVSFYKENENLCKIIIGVLAITVAVAVTFLTGGAALPALLALTKSALIGGLVSAALGGTFAIVVSLVNGADCAGILENTLQSSIDGFCSGFMWGGIFASFMQIISVGHAGTLNSHSKQLAANRKQGQKFENQHFSKFARKYTYAERQITIETSSGIKTRVDEIALDKSGNIIINELKSSTTAPLTGNQASAFPDILKSGGVIKGAGKGIFKGGFTIPAGTEVKIIRASHRYVDYSQYLKSTGILSGILGGGDAIISQ